MIPIEPKSLPGRMRMLLLHIRKLRVLRQPYQVDRTDRAVSLFCNDDLGNALHIRIMIIVIVTIDKHYDVGVLLDGSRLTKIGEHRTVIRSLDNAMTGTESSLASALREREISEISC